MLDGGPKFTGIIGLNNHDYDLSQGFYHKLGEGSNMSIDSFASLQTSNGGGSVAMSIDNSSVGSNTNDSHTRILNHQGLRRRNDNYSVAQSVNREEDFCSRAFGKLYRGTYKAEEVAIKILERPENDPEKAQLMEQQFQQEVMMLATLKHPNIVRLLVLVGSLWCGASSQNMQEGISSAVFDEAAKPCCSFEIGSKTGLGCWRGMAYVHGLGLIHRDLKSDNLLIFGDKSIKIADFGVATY
ncbi:hypothetical protein FNV43_RR20946 [Rhamnella rubrinervis]|uniref:Protein kinase domain-containing protein n=1 Tax=Rhamnella rubrinervis TaxID=2594499 RepID=A0A8K0DZR8_9ROSA|nr:hypothetical protein FNV43_RR20946 [Rhamnella rubrinervis]